MRTVLIITYYWPPSGGSGVQRWLKFTRYLEEKGWHAIVVTPENPQFDTRDESLLTEVHEETEVLKIPIWEPYHLVARIKGKDARVHQGSTSKSTSGWMKTIRGNVTLPDPRVFWKRPVVRFMKEFLKNRTIDAMITTGPPHSMHLIGKKLHKKKGIPWLVDFRDPWSTWDMLNEFNTSRMARSIHKQLEASVVNGAEAVMTVSPTWARELQQRYNKKIYVITNGYDPGDFPDEPLAKPDKFRLMHFGLINEFRHVPKFWQMMGELVNEVPELQKDLEICLYGVMDDQLKEYFTVTCPVSEYIQVYSPIGHAEVLQRYYDAAGLLLFMNRSENADGHIPGKLFEYLATGIPVLAFGNPTGDSAHILDECSASVTSPWEDTASMKRGVLRLYEAWKNGPYQVSAEARKYSRESLTNNLVTLLNAISVKDEHTV